MKIKEVMEIALKAGEILLTSGAEVHRVEDTVTRICRSYNLVSECFVLPTGIFVTVTDKDGDPVSYIKRIRERTVDLMKVERINSFSRAIQINPVTYHEAIKILNGIQSEKGFSLISRLIVAGITAFVYTLIFKGSIQEGIASFIIGMLIFISKEKIAKAGVFHFFEYFASSMIAGIASFIAVRIYPYFDMYKIIISSIIILLPGVAITGALKDALYGDLASSQFRLTEAIFIAVAVGVGVAITLSIGFHWTR